MVADSPQTRSPTLHGACTALNFGLAMGKWHDTMEIVAFIGLVSPLADCLLTDRSPAESSTTPLHISLDSFHFIYFLSSLLLFPGGIEDKSTVDSGLPRW